MVVLSLHVQQRIWRVRVANDSNRKLRDGDGMDLRTDNFRQLCSTSDGVFIARVTEN
jgi:hypothetical protein